jgi:hypothetical protein
MATQEEITVGTASLKQSLDQALEAQGKSWEESFIPESDITIGATLVIEAADGAKDQSIDGRQAAGTTALRASIDSAGEGSAVTDNQCSAAVSFILSAVAGLRSKQ